MSVSGKLLRWEGTYGEWVLAEINRLCLFKPVHTTPRFALLGDR